MTERPSIPQEEFTRLLHQSRANGPVDEAILALVYDELRGVAQSLLERERPGHTLAATALVHEAYLKLVGQTNATYENRSQFVAIAAMVMRRILVNHARDRRRLKRGGGGHRIEFSDDAFAASEANPDLVALDESLHRLAQIDPRKVRVVELRYFAGQTIDECAAHLGVSVAMVRRDWAFAQAWLRRDLSEGEQAAADDDE